MKNIIKMLIAGAFAACLPIVSPAENSAAVVKKHHRPPNVKIADEPKLENPQSFSFILFGDPQSYIKFDFNQPLFEYMTAWAAAQKKNLNVKTLLCTGDLVEQNDNIVNGGQIYGGQNCGNQPSTLQWKSVSRAFGRLDNVYPYILSTGNHDYGYDSSEVRRTRFTEFFDVARNHSQWGEHLVASYPNGEGRASLENAAYGFVCGNWKLLVISIEFTPRDEVLQWAKSVCDRKQYKDHKVIILTHSILDSDGKFFRDKYKMTINNGADIYEKLLSKCPNIKLAICGHTGDTKTMASRKTETTPDGRKVEIFMFNPQAISGWDGNGGDGWLRILEFLPDGKTLSVRTFSPLFAFSQKTQHLSWENSPEHKFKLVLE